MGPTHHLSPPTALAEAKAKGRELLRIAAEPVPTAEGSPERLEAHGTLLDHCFDELAEETERCVRAAAEKELTDRFNQIARRLFRFESQGQWSEDLAGEAQRYCRRAVLFVVNGLSLESQGISAPLREAAAFANAVDTREMVVAARTRRELSRAIAELLGEEPEERCYLFPLTAGGRVAAVLYADGPVQVSALELLASLATAGLPTSRAKPAGLVNLSSAEKASLGQDLRRDETGHPETS